MYAVQIWRLQRKFNYSAGSVIALDETAVWFNVLAESTIGKTGKKDILFKTTRHEKEKVSVCLTGKANAMYLKPFIIFGGTMWECSSLNEEFKSKSAIKYDQMDGWMRNWYYPMFA